MHWWLAMSFARMVQFFVKDPRVIAHRNVDGGPVVVKGMGGEDAGEDKLSRTHGKCWAPGGFEGNRGGLH